MYDIRHRLIWAISGFVSALSLLVLMTLAGYGLFKALLLSALILALVALILWILWVSEPESLVDILAPPRPELPRPTPEPMLSDAPLVGGKLNPAVKSPELPAAQHTEVDVDKDDPESDSKKVSLDAEAAEDEADDFDDDEFDDESGDEFDDVADDGFDDDSDDDLDDEFDDDLGGLGGDLGEDIEIFGEVDPAFSMTRDEAAEAMLEALYARAATSGRQSMVRSKYGLRFDPRISARRGKPEKPAPRPVIVLEDVETPEADDLLLILGIDPQTGAALERLGVTRFAQIAAADAAEIARLEAALGQPGRILRERWPEQAADLLAADELAANTPASDKTEG